ncbi:MAG: HAMP domain-containing histidine kinase, partial [Campylobacteraceae bacterium]|nr:HAMP domain-containing histidine kinase [Campylobacteraceae bacterium]
ALLYNPQTKVLFQKKNKKALIRVLKLQGDTYVFIRKNNDDFLLKDKNPVNGNGKLVIFLVFGVILVTLIISYLTTLRKLYPLKILKDKVTTLGDENFDFDCCDTTKKDEVSLLALEFKNTALKLQRLKESRNIFIRNIMHELKTPITKGKFLIELNNTEENSEKLKKVFNKLESLINEFASIEELITSSRKNLEKNHFFLEDIVDEAVDTLMLEDNILENHSQNLKLFVHFKLFSVAIKNLIDNGVKYSSDKKVKIYTIDEDIIVENMGNALENELETYFEPFSKDENKQKDSFGLGLYIVHNILKANEYRLEYEHKNGINKFTCVKETTNT